jgi:hypothetical protein
MIVFMVSWSALTGMNILGMVLESGIVTLPVYDLLFHYTAPPAFYYR